MQGVHVTCEKKLSSCWRSAQLQPKLSIRNVHVSVGMQRACSFLRRANVHRCQSTASLQPYSSGAVKLNTGICDLSSTRGVLRLGGAELIPFLQGLLTNDVNSLGNQSSLPIYAVLLNAQGRHLHDLFLNRTDDRDAVVLADVDSNALPDLRRKLLMYKLRSAVDVADVSDEYTVWARFGQEDSGSGKWADDPRLSSLGQRMVLPKGEAPETGDASTADPDDYAQFRYQLGIAEGDTEMPSGNAMPLEYNLDALHGVSYSKGCYVGQELIARTHNRGVVRKRLMPIAIEGQAPAINASIEPVEGGSEAGKIRAVFGSMGLAHMRLKQGLQAVQGDLELKSGDSTIKLLRPEWWPQEWGHEEE